MSEMVTVCMECLRACCWQGEFMCEMARSPKSTGVKEMPRSELEALDLEHPSYWDREAS